MADIQEHAEAVRNFKQVVEMHIAQALRDFADAVQPRTMQLDVQIMTKEDFHTDSVEHLITRVKIIATI